MANDAEIVIGIRGDVGGARTIKRSLDDVSNSADRATKQTDRLERQTKSLTRATNALKGAFAGLIAGFSIRELTRVSDTFTTIETQLKNVTNSTAQYNKVFNDLFKIAQKNGDSFQGLNQTYVQLNSSLPDAVRNSYDLVKVTELLSRGFAASGSSAQAASNTMVQITQGLAGNFANAAQEINSLIEGAPLLAKIISVELGGSAATDLKKFAEAGDLTRESFLNALLAAEEAIKAYEIPATIGRSLQRLSNSFLRLVGESETLMGMANGVSRAIDFLAQNLDTLLKIVGVLVITSLPALIKMLAVGVVGAVNAATKAVLGLNTALKANIFVRFGTIIAAIVGSIYMFRKEIFEAARDVKIGGVEITDIFFGIKNTAIEVFKSLVDIIALPMNLLVAKFKKIIAELKVAANSIPGVNLEITTQDLAFSELSGAEIASRITRQTLRRTGGTFTRAAERTRQDIAEFEKLGKITDDIGLTDTGLGTPPPSRDSPLSKEVEKVTKQIKDPMTDAIKDLSDTIERDFATAFKNAFSGTEGGFKRLVEGMKASFTNFLGEVAYQAAARPILMSLGVVGGGMAGAGAAQAGGLSGLLGGAGGGGFSLGNLGSMASSLLNGGLYSSTLGGIGSNIATTFGGGQVASFIGSQALGNLGYGAIGGGIASLLGLGGGIGGTIGGTLGSVAGGGIGASLGTIAGFAGGPVGSIVGSFLGTALGGLFGGKKPSDKAQSAGINFSTGSVAQGGMTGSKFSQENRDFADRVIQEAENLSILLKSAGAQIEGSLNVVVGNRDGLRLNTGTGERNFGTNSAAFIKAVSQAVIDSVVNAPEDLQNVLKNLSGFDTAQMAEAIGILELVRSFEDAGEASQPLKDALDILDAQFNELASKAAGLGLPIDKLTESYQKQKDAIIRDTLAPLQQWLDAQALSGTSSLSPVERLSLSRSRFDEVMSQIGMGDFSNLGNVTNLASNLLSAGRDVFASGEGFSSLERFVRESVAGVGTSLGAPEGSLQNGLTEMAINSAEQTSLSQQMLVELQALREENRRLRKSMERVGNAVMTS